jgi:hypothetical protein
MTVINRKPQAPVAAEPDPQWFDDSPSEHIQLASEEFLDEPRKAETLRAEFRLRDRWHGAVSTFRLFDEDLLAVDERRRGKQIKLHEIDLRHLDPAVQVRTLSAGKTWYAVLTCMALAGMGLLLELAPPVARFAAPTIAVAALGTLLTLALCLYRTRTDFVFVTANGRAPAVALRAPFGSRRRGRQIAAELATAIRQAHEAKKRDKPERLRAEMREHYRLQDAGVISSAQCVESTTRILAQFG